LGFGNDGGQLRRAGDGRAAMMARAMRRAFFSSPKRKMI
jgi:hypothetical protein